MLDTVESRWLERRPVIAQTFETFRGRYGAAALAAAGIPAVS